MAAEHNAINAPLDFWERANSIHNPVGVRPGEGWFLLSAFSVGKLDLNAAQSIVWVDENGSNTFPKYYVRQAIKLGKDGDNQAPYLLKVEDRRCMWRLSTANAQYNVRMPAPSSSTPKSTRYYAATTTSGNLWSWQTLFKDLWDRLFEAGTAPTLGWFPPGDPESLRFLGVPTVDAVEQVLKLCVSDIAFDPVAGTFESFKYGDTQSGLADAKSRLATGTGNRLNCSWVGKKDVNVAYFPEKITVYFHRKQVYHGQYKDTHVTSSFNWEVDPLYSITLNTSIPQAKAGTKIGVFGQPYAEMDWNAAVVNSTELTTYATQLVAKLVARMDVSGERGQWQYQGIASQIKTGSEIHEVIYRDYGDGVGLVTEAREKGDKGMDLDMTGPTENSQPPDLSRISHPLWPNLVQIVKIISGVGGVINADGNYPGEVAIYADGAYKSCEPCWIKLTNLNAPKQQPDDTFIGRLSGVFTTSGDTRPLYLCESAGNTYPLSETYAFGGSGGLGAPGNDPHFGASISDGTTALTSGIVALNFRIGKVMAMTNPWYGLSGQTIVFNTKGIYKATITLKGVLLASSTSRSTIDWSNGPASWKNSGGPSVPQLSYLRSNDPTSVVTVDLWANFSRLVMHEVVGDRVPVVLGFKMHGTNVVSPDAVWATFTGDNDKNETTWGLGTQGQQAFGTATFTFEVSTVGATWDTPVMILDPGSGMTATAEACAIIDLKYCGPNGEW